MSLVLWYWPPNLNECLPLIQSSVFWIVVLRRSSSKSRESTPRQPAGELLPVKVASKKASCASPGGKPWSPLFADHLSAEVAFVMGTKRRCFPKLNVLITLEEIVQKCLSCSTVGISSTSLVFV